MFSFIILTIILLSVSFKTIKYSMQHFTPMALVLGILAILFLATLWDVRFDLVNVFDLEKNFSILKSADFYWVISILFFIGVIVLRDLNRNLYFERLTTDLVRKLAIEGASECK
jgi:hypothetical protein